MELTPPTGDVQQHPSKGQRAAQIAKVVYLGKPGVHPGLRIGQGFGAVLLTMTVLGAALPAQTEEQPTKSDVTLSATSSEAAQAAEMAAAAKAEAARAAAARVEAARQAAAARRAEAARIAAQREAAAKAAAAKAAAEKAAADRLAAQRAAAEKAEAEAATAEAPQPVAPQVPTSSCHPDYRTCVPVSSSDLDCPDIGKVVYLRQIGVDPYGLDADDDGIGCESYG